MNKLITLILLLSNLAISQHIYIKDSLNFKAIQNPIVKLYKDGLHSSIIIADSLGGITITENIDSLVISHLSYLTKTIKNTNNLKNIYLTQKTTTLEKVEVHLKRGKVLTIGKHKKKDKSSFGRIMPFTKTATKFVPPNQKRCFVNKIILNVIDVPNKAQISIRVFEIDSSFYFVEKREKEKIIGEVKIKQLIPRNEIEIENCYFEIAKNVTDSIIELDVSKMGIILPKEGFFLSLTSSVYDTNNNLITNQNSVEYPKISTYKNKEDNFCFILKSPSKKWLNLYTYLKASRKYYSYTNAISGKNPTIKGLSIGLELVEIE